MLPADDSVENLRTKLRELEKRCALQQLRHEEVLLELEDVRKRARTSADAGPFHGLPGSVISLDSVYRSNTDLNLLGHSAELGITEGRVYNVSNRTSNTSNLHTQIKGRLFGNSTGGPIKTVHECTFLLNADIPAPRAIAVERQLIHSILISWKPPEPTVFGQTVSAYHVYVDGQFRLSVKAKERTRALLDRVDVDKPHRISVRAICSKGQSKDAECTMVVGRGMTATPGRLRATQIGTKSAKLSWMPGNSNYSHRVYLNQCELQQCPPRVYKVLLTDLCPDKLHCVCVQALPPETSHQQPEQVPPPPSRMIGLGSGVDTQKLAAYIEFRTLPIGLPDPPTNVQIEPGPQDGSLLITWVPVPQDQGAVEAVTAAGAGSTLPVQGYTVCLNEHSLMEVDGASNDHAIISLQKIKEHLKTTSSFEDDGHDFSSHQSNVGFKVDLGSTPFTSAVGPPAQSLFITVHSTVLSALADNEQNTTTFAEKPAASELLKGAGGPASLPVHLKAEVLIAAAGSLESAIRLFGPRLSSRLGMDETASRRAGVPLTSVYELPLSPTPTSQPDPVTRLEPGLITISADPSNRKLSPTADAIGSAEALLRRRKLEDYHEQAAVNSSPETKRQDKIVFHRGYPHSKVKSDHVLAPWPWPDPHSRQAGRSSRVRSPAHRRHQLRQAWGQTRSMSDDYDPTFRCAASKYSGCYHEESDDMAPLSDKRVDESCCYRTRSLYNLNAPHPSRSWRPRGLAKSSWDLRNLPMSHVYATPERYARLGQTSLRFRDAFPNSMHFETYWRPRHKPGFWPPLANPNATIISSRIAGAHHLLRRRVEMPGPIMTAFSSSSTEDKLSFPLSARVPNPKFDRINVSAVSASYEPRPINRPPRSRSTSPRTYNIATLNTFAPPEYDRITRDLITSNIPLPDSPTCLSRERSQTGRQKHLLTGRIRSSQLSAAMMSVPEIRANYESSGQFGPTRPNRSRYMDGQGYGTVGGVEELDFGPSAHAFKTGPNHTSMDFVRIPVSRERPDRNVKHVSPSGTLAHFRSEPSFSAVKTKAVYPSLSESPDKHNMDEAIPRLTADVRPVRLVVALYAYDPATMSPNPDATTEELPFQEGQIIRIFGDRDEDGFYFGECNGLRGLVPSNMVSKPERVIPGTTTNALGGPKNAHFRSQDRTRSEANALPPGQVNKPRSSDSTVLRSRVSSSGPSYGATPFSQSVSKDSRRSTKPIMQTDSQGHPFQYEIAPSPRSHHQEERRTNSTRGLPNEHQQDIYSRPSVPQTFGLQSGADHRSPPCQHVPDSLESFRSRATQEGSHRLVPTQMVAIYDYDPSVLSPNADAEMELSFRTGDRITVYGEMDADGFYSGQLADGRRGLVPSNFLRECDSNVVDGQRPVSARENRIRMVSTEGRANNNIHPRHAVVGGPGSGTSNRDDNFITQPNEESVPRGRKRDEAAGDGAHYWNSYDPQMSDEDGMPVIAADVSNKDHHQVANSHLQRRRSTMRSVFKRD
ncbi:Peripheral-type benzodiazepine receptor-associated protein 1 [Paragonimus heterotremus]|uniref:Peripheral-type benzodiazepine receptor-associated protein 1 n=1 Tax=Paragonimus heterotremus TaxID=100268 RepID=A0A8J4SPJ5_9TREM|nr:Peripheral-type benzodiazepine receptor-associated protein 1 [Paragonimus heterotremus]